MPGLVPESTSRFGFQEPPNALGLAFEALLGFTQAACGWIGLADPVAGMAFPVRRGPVPDAWLDRQAGHTGVWGFAIREGPTLLNDLLPLPGIATSPLNNLLSCPLPCRGGACDHVVVANKPGGFNSHDAAVVQGFAHLLGKLVDVDRGAYSDLRQLAVLPPQFFEQSAEGMFVLDARGALVFANAAWTEWTGFPLEQLLGQTAPFAFWLDYRRWAMLTGGAALRGPTARSSRTAGASQGPRNWSDALPFRRADDTIFWCSLETRHVTWSGSEWTVARLQPKPHAGAQPSAAVGPLANWLALLLRPGQELAWWDERWTKLTGLDAADVLNVPVETALDWLFPMQPEREFVADLFQRPGKKRSGKQAKLHVLEPSGNQPIVCTFLPVPAASLGSSSLAVPLGGSGDAWLLLASPPETPTTTHSAVAVSDPRASFAPAEEEVESVRLDRPSEAPGPHAVPGLASAVEPPPS
jgi:PAS domain S-box-containing protein